MVAVFDAVILSHRFGIIALLMVNVHIQICEEMCVCMYVLGMIIPKFRDLGLLFELQKFQRKSTQIPRLLSIIFFSKIFFTNISTFDERNFLFATLVEL